MASFTSVETALQRARSLAKRGEIEQARQIYSAVLAKYPQNQRASEGLLSLGGGPGLAGMRSGPAGSSQQQLERLLGLYVQGRMDDVVAAGSALARQYPRLPQIPNLIGAAQAMLGRIEEAAQSYAEAVRLDPGYAEAQHNLGNALKALGRTDEAIACYRRAVDLKPAYCEAMRNLGAAVKLSADDPLLGKMRSAYSQSGATTKERMHAALALAKAHEDLGQASEAFRLYCEANRLRKQELGYDIAADQRLMADIERLFCQSSQAPAGGFTPGSALAKRPIFIVGMPRSGTTLVEQILASHSQVHGAGELSTLNRIVLALMKDKGAAAAQLLSPDTLQTIRMRYGEGLRALNTGKSVVTDKMPSNFRWIGFIRLAMPEARIINVVRDPVATCWSVFKTYFATSGNGFSYDLNDVATYYRLYEQLMAFWRRTFPGAVYDLDYEALTEDQEGETQRLVAYCGLDWEAACLQFQGTKRAVDTASATQVRQGMYKGSSQAWRAFEPQLQPLIAALSRN
jgi:tetratricopeptide (TPR) repeat protein